ncbi:uncharacterized protein EI90DRAFT_397370 [Cantharellus anzutake]|uniref:uncharacterized protein n=1 Tax=Cantharellus anzutake TaxID=1750568 RepID=UPI001907F607|nr:uncharacterized protein EI90DRAFT_397370 [Cantharellus anzutake]KAF8335074.1 hypothetical protein EI90DRAFT_397370 [Cantharellus anzutake]
MSLIVSLPSPLDSSRSLYPVDVTILRPLLRDGHIESGMGGEEHRIIRTRHVGSSFEEAEDGHLDEEWGAAQVLWTFQSRQLQLVTAEDGGWKNEHAIAPLECVQEDFNAKNFITSKNPEGFFVRDRCCSILPLSILFLMVPISKSTSRPLPCRPYAYRETYHIQRAIQHSHWHFSGPQ